MVLQSNNSDLMQKQQQLELQQQLSGIMANQSSASNNLGFQQQNMMGNIGNAMGNAILDTSLNSTFSSQNNATATQGSSFSNQSNSFNMAPGLNQLSQGQAARSVSETSWNNSSDVGGTASSGASIGNFDIGNVSNQSSSDPVVVQKKRVILQQQQRLLLLRHASRCTAGPNCTTKFCEQMVTLWNHMKTCRNKNCKTSHCFSSRCVLNDYRICKSNGKTASCEVCGPVMLKIKQQERDDGVSSDPLTVSQDLSAVASSSEAAI